MSGLSECGSGKKKRQRLNEDDEGHKIQSEVDIRLSWGPRVLPRGRKYVTAKDLTREILPVGICKPETRYKEEERSGECPDFDFCLSITTFQWPG